MKYEIDGKIVDSKKGKEYREGQNHNGRNWISLATGKQFEHESLHVSTKGTFWIEEWSNYQGSTQHARIVTKEEAAAWLTKNEYSAETIEKITGLGDQSE